MASTGVFKQEMPPEGGYRKLYFDRILPKKFWTPPKLLAFYLVPPFIWYWGYHIMRTQVYMKTIENRSSFIALEPCLVAERDREYLRQLRKNRDSERELMKDVPGWEVGKWNGDPIFRTMGDEWFDPSITEYYAHTSYANFMKDFAFRHNY